MAYVYAIGVLLVIHLGAINSLSLITGRYRIEGSKPASNIWMNSYHIFGLSNLLLAALALIAIQDYNLCIALSLCVGLMSVDFWCLLKAIRSKN